MKIKENMDITIVRQLLLPTTSKSGWTPTNLPKSPTATLKAWPKIRENRLTLTATIQNSTHSDQGGWFSITYRLIDFV